MAGGYGCEFCEGARNPVWLVTNLANGATFSVCDEDAPVMMIPLLAGMLGADGPKLYEAIKREIDRQARAADKEVAEATKAAGKEQMPDAGGGATQQGGGGGSGGTEQVSPAVAQAAAEGES